MTIDGVSEHNCTGVELRFGDKSSVLTVNIRCSNLLQGHGWGLAICISIVFRSSKLSNLIIALQHLQGLFV